MRYLITKEKEIIVDLPLYIFKYPIRYGYKISNYGYIYDSILNKYYPPNNINTFDGNYYNMYLRDINNKVCCRIGLHRIILMTFNYINGCEYLEVNHKDGYRCHNWLSNLEWATRRENAIHAINNGLVKMGQQRSNSKLKDDQVESICQLLQDGYKTKDIVKILDFGNDINLAQIIGNIKFGHSWSWISRKYNIK